MKSAEIREAYLSFFEGKGAFRLPSSSLVPDDPSLLFTSAGMVQFKPVFLGVKSLGFARAVTCQKCLCTTDIEIIGTTGRHHSFFEMLGNFSFGDYFKSEACAWAYEFSTQVLGLDPERIWYSIYEDDDEAEAIWRDEVGVPAERIVRLGAADNFWSAGPTGPCGPCSELYYDQGEAVGCGSPDCQPGCDCDRFLEYWNLVFMQFDRQEDGSLEPLPNKSIDTGMGLERVAAIMQRVASNFETDDLRAIVSVVEELTGVRFGADAKRDTSIRIMADHSRAVTFMVADGVLPSNEGRGYVLRRLLRRAVRHARLLGRQEPSMRPLVEVVIERFGTQYPELAEHRGLITQICESEEARFSETLRSGLAFLAEETDRMREAGLALFDGKQAFKLHDTFGFPIELTTEILAEQDLGVDMPAFAEEMEAQRQRARAAVKDESWTSFAGAFDAIAAEGAAIEFVGWSRDEADATIVAILKDGTRVDSLAAGHSADIVLSATPFYGEQGGQVGDTGTITSEAGAVFRVSDTKLPLPGITAHIGVLEEGLLSVGDVVSAEIDVARRERIRRNHTATHILHWALKLVLGDHVRQAGSYVTFDRMRFDFTHFEAPGADVLHKIERMTNAKIMENHPVRAYETSLTTARESGVTALFGEKYEDFVRVLEVGNFSKELCGGTHVARTSEIGLLKIVSEGSVGANLRRIEAVTSFDAFEWLDNAETELLRVAGALNVPRTDVFDRVIALQKRLKDAENAAKRPLADAAGPVVDELVASAVDIGYKLVIARVPDRSSAALREVWDLLKVRAGESSAVVLASVDPQGGAPLLLAAGGKTAVDTGFDAGGIIKAIAPAIGGGGGGRPSMAQAGGKDAAGIDAALDRARQMLSDPGSQG